MQQHGQSPYAKSVKVKVICHGDVVHYRNDKQEDRQLLNAVIADHTQAVKCTIYDVQKFNRFVEGKTIIIRNCIKTENIVVTTNTKVFPAGNIDVPVAIERERVQYFSLHLLDGYLWQRPLIHLQNSGYLSE